MTIWLLPDAPPVTEDMALEFMAHHLTLAAMYFEQVPDNEETRNELARLLRCQDPRRDEDAPRIAAGLLFYDKILQLYDDMEH